MIRQFTLLVWTGTALASSFVVFAQGVNQTPPPEVTKAAAAAFPANLRFATTPTANAKSPNRSYESCATVFSTSTDGTPAMIAAGYSGNGSEISLLDYNAGVATIVAAVTNKQFWFTNGQCEIEKLNLADPRQPASPLARVVKASFGGADWFFIWDGRNLRNITALDSAHLKAYGSEWGQHHTRNSAMYFSDVVDLDHSGPMQIVGRNGDADKSPRGDGISSSGTFTLFRFTHAAYTPAETLIEFIDDRPNLPQPRHDDIQMHSDPASNYELKIVNGDRDGSNRVTSAEVEVNGVTIVLANEINQGVEVLKRSVQLQKENEIGVTVDGPDKSHVYVTVE